ncbi:amidohydrolase family-domain-containing protein [Obelidium mucronatum]|nr:amidohydrolase family-domain-containing protein [Obelidium mucronatum]
MSEKSPPAPKTSEHRRRGSGRNRGATGSYPQSWVALAAMVVLLQALFAVYIFRQYAFPSPSERYLILNATLYTLDPTSPDGADAFVVDAQGRFEVIGSTPTLSAKYWNLKQYNAHRKLIIPGLVDSHAHLLHAGVRSMQANLAKSKSVKDVVSRLVRFLNANPEFSDGGSSSGKWLQGHGWDQTLWPGSSFPTAADLDAHPRLKNIPIALVRIDGHAMWCNSLALALSSIPRDPNVPIPGGEVIRDPETGLPTGVLIDNAMAFVSNAIPPLDLATKRKGVQIASKLMLEKGLTGLHDAGVSIDDISLFKSMIDDGQFFIRNYAMILCDLVCESLPQKIEDGYKNGLLTVKSVKLVMDGALGSWGAAMIDPYSDAPTKRGILKIPEQNVLGLIKSVISQSYQVNVHCIGDLANKLALDAFESISNSRNDGGKWMKSLRNRIEHSQIMRVSDIKRFGSLGVIPSVQPTHATSDMSYAESRLGKSRLAGSYIWKSFLQDLPHLPLGSDFPVENLDPMKGIYAATTRKWENGSSPAGEDQGWYPHERLTRLEALKGFTISAAYAAFQEDVLGSISAGKWADFVVYEDDWIKEEEDGGHVGELDLLAVSPTVTVVGGVPRFGKLLKFQRG